MHIVTRLSALTLIAAATLHPAAADDMPSRKPGLWQVVMVRSGRNMSANEIKSCIDANTDAEMFKMGMSSAQSICSRMESHRDGDVFTTSAVCKINETEMTSRSVSHFSGNSAYHSDITTKFDPPLMGKSESVMAQDAKWMGPCPPDMQPGDIVMGNGMKMNMKSMASEK
jgi:hypothetical protein